MMQNLMSQKHKDTRNRGSGKAGNVPNPNGRRGCPNCYARVTSTRASLKHAPPPTLFVVAGQNAGGGRPIIDHLRQGPLGIETTPSRMRPLILARHTPYLNSFHS